MAKHQRALVVGVLAAALSVASVGVAAGAQLVHHAPSEGNGVVLGTAPFVGGAGLCADGICAWAMTRKAVAYPGGDSAHQRDAADYESKAWDPRSCGAASATAADCGYGGIDHWRQTSPATYVQPGVQVYEDPNPDALPVGPYPLPAVAVTTCGIVLGGGAVSLPATALTNGAGQLVVETPC
jgi:hypothetical protein